MAFSFNFLFASRVSKIVASNTDELSIAASRCACTLSAAAIPCSYVSLSESYCVEVTKSASYPIKSFDRISTSMLDVPITLKVKTTSSFNLPGIFTGSHVTGKYFEKPVDVSIFSNFSEINFDVARMY